MVSLVGITSEFHTEPRFMPARPCSSVHIEVSHFSLHVLAKHQNSVVTIYSTKFAPAQTVKAAPKWDFRCSFSRRLIQVIVSHNIHDIASTY